MMDTSITAEQLDRWRQFAQAGWSLEAKAVLALLHELTALRAERDALSSVLADAIDAHTPDDVLARAQALLASEAPTQGEHDR